MDYQRRARELEKDAEQLSSESKKLANEIQIVKQDWEGKKNDNSLPGAQHPDSEPHASLVQEGADDSQD
jgi:hypothetical protein